MRVFFCSCALLACHAARPAVVTLEGVADASPAARAIAAPEATSGAVVFRVLREVYVEDDAGTPTNVSVTVQIEAGGRVFGPLTVGAPSCSLVSAQPDAGILAVLSCYYAGAGDYVELEARGHGDYALVAYGQGESYTDEPNPPRQGEHVVGTFRDDDADLDVRIVSADGGVYRD
ncbi:MAG TPA: hypothetical protein VGH28_31425 [Polyangiaceae bacterium]|jgi:hypothetical protein